MNIAYDTDIINREREKAIELSKKWVDDFNTEYTKIKFTNSSSYPVFDISCSQKTLNPQK